MDATMKVQAQIRQNADEISSYLKDLSKWEKTIKTRDQKLRGVEVGGTVPPRGRAGGIRSAGTVTVSSNTPAALPVQIESKENSAAQHTYDVGYKKWEKFNVDEALRDDEYSNSNSNISTSSDNGAITTSTARPQSVERSTAARITPATLPSPTPFSAPPTPASVPRARGEASQKDMELAERERGNSLFQAGNFAMAVKCYTTCLGLKVGTCDDACVCAWRWGGRVLHIFCL
jgi:hypothetical protein